jgi:hypothetical protein
MGVGAERGDDMERVLGLFVLVVAGILSLPVAAAAFDGEGSENWIIPAQLGGMAVIGALVGLAIPGLTGAESSGRRALAGAAIGVGMALLGVLIFFLLLNGFDGA